MYKRQAHDDATGELPQVVRMHRLAEFEHHVVGDVDRRTDCLLYTSDAADERSSVDLGGRRIIKKKKQVTSYVSPSRDRP